MRRRWRRKRTGQVGLNPSLVALRFGNVCKGMIPTPDKNGTDIEFIKILQDSRNGTDADSAVSSENPALANEADAVGYSKPSIIEFTNLLQSFAFGTDAKNGDSSENPALANEADGITIW